MDKKIRIIIQVGKSRYPLWIDREEEPIFREAARMVNRRLIAYNTQFRGSHLSPEAILSMAAVDLAIKCQRVQHESNPPELQSELTSIVNDLQQFEQPKQE